MAGRYCSRSYYRETTCAHPISCPCLTWDLYVPWEGWAGSSTPKICKQWPELYWPCPHHHFKKLQVNTEKSDILFAHFSLTCIVPCTYYLMFVVAQLLCPNFMSLCNLLCSFWGRSKGKQYRVSMEKNLECAEAADITLKIVAPRSSLRVFGCLRKGGF